MCVPQEPGRSKKLRCQYEQTGASGKNLLSSGSPQMQSAPAVEGGLLLWTWSAKVDLEGAEAALEVGPCSQAEDEVAGAGRGGSGEQKA